MKKGQISNEVMYAVGVMLLIFLMLNGITFEQRSDLRNLQDILERKSECLKLASALSEIWTSSDYGVAEVFLRYNATVYRDGVIIMEGETGRRVTTEASCTFVAFLNDTKTAQSYKGKVNITNYQGNVTIQ